MRSRRREKINKKKKFQQEKKKKIPEKFLLHFLWNSIEYRCEWGGEGWEEKYEKWVENLIYIISDDISSRLKTFCIFLIYYKFLFFSQRNGKFEFNPKS